MKTQPSRAQFDSLIDTQKTKNLFRFIWRVSGRHQFGVVIISIILFSIGTLTLEFQRRIINAASQGGSYDAVALLALAYAGLAFGEGSVKLGLNIYRSWISEAAIRWLRLHIFEVARRSPLSKPSSLDEGVQLSIVISEAEPIGGFVGDSISQPVLQLGTLCTVTAYLIYLQPLMALVVSVVFIPQFAFVPLLQNAINRRVAGKTTTLREVSASIVEAGGAIDETGQQRSRIETVFALNMGIYKIKFGMNFLMNLMTQMGYVGILTLGSYYVVTGKTEIGTVVAFLSGLAKINDPWGDFVDWYRSLRVTEVKYDLVRQATDLAGGSPLHNNG
jgi:ABC-type multidrug transport system fused ATPase/permease subunit